MNRTIANLLEQYDLKTQDDYETAIKEIIQRLTLLGLWRSIFYDKVEMRFKKWKQLGVAV